MSVRHARPGMKPSPNQQLVLDEIKRLYGILTRDGDDPHIGFKINFIHWHFKDRKLGGGTYGNLGWVPWHRSTIRDHMNDLVGKDHLSKQIICGTAYYKPTEES